MTLKDLRYFATPEGRGLLQAAAETPGDDLVRLTRLRKRFPPARCRAAVALVALRQRAGAKYTRSADMVFDREGLEQATGETIAAYRARRYRGFGRIADLCCGIGGDTTALAGVGEVLAVDRDAARVGMALWNAAVCGVAGRVRGIAADLSVWMPAADALFMDPARRKGDRRFLSPGDYLPPVHLERFLAVTPHIGIKVAPGIPYGEIPPDCEVEFISEAGACKEAVLWFGKLKTDAGRRATLLPSEETLVFRPFPEAPVNPPGAFLYEPDRAVIRAHLIDQLAEDLNAWKLDPQVAYLSADHRVETPFARCYRITDIIPFGLKRLQNYLNTHRIGQLEIKKRRFPLTPEDLRGRLKLKGEARATLVLTRIADRPIVVVCCPEETD